MKEIETCFANFYKKDEEVYRNVAVLAKIGGPEVIERLLKMLYEEDLDIQYLAVKTLAQIENNQSALPDLFSAIHDPKLKSRNGSLVEALDGFDVSDHFDNIFAYGLATSTVPVATSPEGSLIVLCLSPIVVSQ